LPHVVATIDATGKGEDRGGLSCAWRTVEEEMWEAVAVDEFVDGG
jgi:hypothetical protein